MGKKHQLFRLVLSLFVFTWLMSFFQARGKNRYSELIGENFLPVREDGCKHVQIYVNHKLMTRRGSIDLLF